jgi:hypothetical protein
MPCVPSTRSFLRALAAAVALPLVAAGQPTPPAPRAITLGEAHVIQSAIMGEPRELQLSLPPSYGRTTVAYPVLVMLDGSSHLLHATATTRFLASARERIPEFIVVTIPNTDRNRDLTPGAGATRFQRFIAEEVLPWIERGYRAAPERVLMGHSLGGSFTVHTLLNRPELFDAYIAVSAPLWRYEGLAGEARPGLARAARAGAAVYLAVGDLERANERLFGAMRSFAALADSLGPAAPAKWFTILPGEDHSSTSARALYAALEARYAGWSFPFYEDLAELTAAGGVAGLEAHYQRLSTQFGFPALPPDGRLVQAARLLIADGQLEAASALAERYRAPYPALADGLRRRIAEERCRVTPRPAGCAP